MPRGRLRNKNLGRDMNFFSFIISNILCHEGRLNTLLRILKFLHFEATPSRQTVESQSHLACAYREQNSLVRM